MSGDNVVLVNVKWGKQLFSDVEIDTNEPASVFKMQLWTLTGVPLPRQTIIGLKGGKLKDDSDWSKAAPKPGQTLMLMGTPDESSLAPPPTDDGAVFDDLDADASAFQEAPVNHPPGLDNLGNTCYMNSTIQCLNAVPELRTALAEFRGSTTALNPGEKLAAGLRDLTSRMASKNSASINPQQFLYILRQVNPQFGERSPQGIFMQQDAEECWGEIVSRLSAALTSSSASGNEIDKAFSLTVKSTDTCEEEDSNEVVHRTEEIRALKCHITVAINHMTQGISDALEEKVEKHSETLGRSAMWKRKSRIDRISPYLVVQFVRFAWKRTENVKAKILRNVSFPANLDVYDFCTDELKAALDVKREAVRTAEESNVSTALSGATPELSTAEPADAPGITTHDAAAADATIAEPLTIIAPLVADTGYYTLSAVLTHQGRAADSGHYVAWVKDKKSAAWLKYDDDKVSVHTEEEIMKLSGGGDWPIAYMALYQAKPSS
jgi:ubiquitin carboxyl-terminal hydrolase 14